MGKTVQVPWAALRLGLRNRDWGKDWLAAMAEANLPGNDFVILAPNKEWTGFKERIADFYDAQAAMRALLIMGGMDATAAMEFSCHSWRHLYPTAGRQLDLNPDHINSMGHWAHGSGMAAKYDSMACVSELVQKVKVRDAFVGGWALVDPGCVPAMEEGTVPQPSHPPKASHPMRSD